MDCANGGQQLENSDLENGSVESDDEGHTG